MSIIKYLSNYNDTNYTGGVPLLVDHIENLQIGATEGLMSLILGLAELTNVYEPYILYGLETIQTGSDVVVTEGALLFIDSQNPPTYSIYYVEAQTVSNANASDIWIEMQDDVTSVNPLLDAGGTLRNINKLKRGIAKNSQPAGDHIKIINRDRLEDRLKALTGVNNKADVINSISLQSPSFLNGWGAAVGNEPKFWEDQFNMVHLEGIAEAGSINKYDVAITNLPAPAKDVYFTCTSVDLSTNRGLEFTQVRITNNNGVGEAEIGWPSALVPTYATTSLAGISYRKA